MARMSDDLLQLLQHDLRGKSGPQARVLIRDLARSTGLSEGTLYRVTAEARRGGRKTRSDAGASRLVLAPEVEAFMEQLTVRADLAASHVLYVTSQHFGLPADFMSTTAYNTWLRRLRIERRLRTRDVRPYRPFEAARANDLHHYDTTVAEAYYVNDDGSVGYEPGFQRYKNKPGNKRPRLILASLIDDCSRVLFARFYVSENTFNLLDFVYRAWSQKADRRFPFYGLPTYFYADKGSTQRSHRFLRALDKLGVEMVDSLPSHSTPFGSRKHGKVERTFGAGLYGEFMKWTQIVRFPSVDDLNATLENWLVWMNNRAHSVTKEIRFARWVRTVGTPRSMPSAELYQLLHYECAQRVVTGNLQVQINGHTYQLPFRKPFINWVGCSVEVYWLPGKSDTISVVYDHHEEELTPLAPVIDLALDYKRIETTERDARLARINAGTLGDLNVAGLYRTDVPYLPRKGKAFDETQIAEKQIETETGTRYSFAAERKLNRLEVAREVRAAGFTLPNMQTNMRMVDEIMAGREQISEEILALALSQYRKTGTDA